MRIWPVLKYTILIWARSACGCNRKVPRTNAVSKEAKAAQFKIINAKTSSQTDR